MFEITFQSTDVTTKQTAVFHGPDILEEESTDFFKTSVAFSSGYLTLLLLSIKCGSFILLWHFLVLVTFLPPGLNHCCWTLFDALMTHSVPNEDDQPPWISVFVVIVLCFLLYRYKVTTDIFVVAILILLSRLRCPGPVQHLLDPDGNSWRNSLLSWLTAPRGFRYYNHFGRNSGAGGLRQFSQCHVPFLWAYLHSELGGPSETEEHS